MIFNYKVSILTRMLPIRCFTCNKVLANKGATFEALKSEGKEYPEIWNTLGLKRMCCQIIMMTHVDNTDEMMVYDNYNPCKYVEIRRHPPDNTAVDSGTDITASLQNLSLESKSKPRVYLAR